MAAELSWKARRRGTLYCAPACGGGCTWDAYQQALEDAKALRAKLRGNGWKITVWENLGWHYKVVSGPVQVYPSIGGLYFAMISNSPIGGTGGAGFWMPPENRLFKDPNRAISYAMTHVYAFVDRIAETVRAAERAIGKQRKGSK